MKPTRPSERIEQIIKEVEKQRRDHAIRWGHDIFEKFHPAEAIIQFLDEQYELNEKQNGLQANSNKA